jgi:hypothetical protein
MSQGKCSNPGVRKRYTVVDRKRDKKRVSDRDERGEKEDREMMVPGSFSGSTVFCNYL